MNRFFKTVFLALVIVGGLWVLFNQEQIQQAGGLSAYIGQNLNQLRSRSFPQSRWNRQSNWSTEPTRLRSTAAPTEPRSPFTLPRTGARPDLSPASDQAHRLPFDSNGEFHVSDPLGLPAGVNGKIRIASFKMNAHFQPAIQSGSLKMLTDICCQFDIVAFQEINSHSIALLEQVGQRAAIESNGAIKFRAISDAARSGPSDPLFVILYNTVTLDLDFANWYSVNDPDQLLIRQPLVGWFRTRGVESDDAFTFTLANIQLDDHRPDLELAYIGNLFRAIRQDGRGEDDVIITGNFNAGDRGLSAMRQRAGLTWVVYDTATSTDKKHQYDNLVFAQNATVEFTGQGGVFDFLSAYNLPLADAQAVSQHMPVWAEFSIREGNRPAAPTAPSEVTRPVHLHSVEPRGTPINRPSF